MDRTHTVPTPRIYVASLSDYNAGRLHGRWINADQPADAIADEVRQMLAESRESGAEEWAIHDYENFAGLNLSEWESFEKVAEIAANLEAYGSAWAKYAEHVGPEYATDFDDAYQGEYDSEADFAQELAEELGAIPSDYSWPVSCIDWDRAARDLFMGDYLSIPTPDGRVLVFRSM